jgi:hypothetical protein
MYAFFRKYAVEFRRGNGGIGAGYSKLQWPSS